MKVFLGSVKPLPNVADQKNSSLTLFFLAVIDERSYRYDQNSNILNIDTNVEDNAYTYDPRDRIVGDSIDQNESFLFDYDLNDNRQSKAQATGIQQLLSYAPASNRVSFIDTVQRDATAPALATLPERELVYNDANRLYQLIENGTLTTAYLYNDTGQRTRKITYQSDGQTVDTITVYHYDMMGYLVTETTETGALIKDYIWREGMNPVAQIDSSSGAEQVSYLHTDHLMTNRLATNPAQQVIWRWEGEAFGSTPAQELASIQVNLRFPGQYFDIESNLFYNNQRYYDSSVGRYITSDMLGLKAAFNTYDYTGANPIVRYDEDGLFWVQAGCFLWDKVSEWSGNAAKEWQDDVDRNWDHNTSMHSKAYDQMVKNCIHDYQSHRDDCRLRKCLDDASDWNDKMRREEHENWKQGSANNPYPSPLGCVSPSKPYPRRRPNNI